MSNKLNKGCVIIDKKLVSKGKNVFFELLYIGLFFRECGSWFVNRMLIFFIDKFFLRVINNFFRIFR